MKRKIFNQNHEAPTKLPKITHIPVIPNFEEAFDYLFNLYPYSNRKQFGYPIILKSQLYALNENRTNVDSQLLTLLNKHQLRLLNIEDQIDDSVGIMRATDFLSSFKNVANKVEDIKLLEQFSNYALNETTQLSVNKENILKQFSDKQISTLVQYGALIIKSESSWWISVPSLGIFNSTYRTGQKALLTILRRTRFKELLLSDILRRKLGSGVSFGHMYHILAHLGAGTLTSNKKHPICFSHYPFLLPCNLTELLKTHLQNPEMLNICLKCINKCTQVAKVSSLGKCNTSLLSVRKFIKVAIFRTWESFFIRVSTASGPLIRLTCS